MDWSRVFSMKNRAYAGAWVGVLVTLVACWLGLATEFPELPSLLRSIVSVLISPFLLPAAFITTSMIVGGTYDRPDFFMYVLPISLVINMSVGAGIGYFMMQRTAQKQQDARHQKREKRNRKRGNHKRR